MERNPHGKNYTNGLNIKVCLLFIVRLDETRQILIIKIDMSKILIIEDEADPKSTSKIL
jgi:hypothetical protein